jgi:hypothetical protein
MAVTKEQLATMAQMSNDALEGTSVHELALEAQDVIDDTDVKEGQFAHTPTTNDPYAMIIEEASSAGKSVVYDIRNGDASIVNNNMLATQLAKTDLDTGKRIFTTRRSDAPEIISGKYLCLLHEEHPDREFHKRLGLGTCNKSNLRTLLDVRTHAQNRHQQEWNAIYENRDQEREDQERRIRELTLSKLVVPAAADAAAQVQRDIGAAQVPVAEVPETSFSAYSGTCPDCEWTNDATKATSRKTAYYKHKSKVHTA